jgi:hypothetical protein
MAEISHHLRRLPHKREGYLIAAFERSLLRVGFCKDGESIAETYLNEANKSDGSNFINWKIKMQTLMEGYDVWTIAKGDEVRPDAAAGVTMTKILDWDRRENKANVLLRMSVKDSIILHIRDAKTSSETWKALKDLYQTNNTNHIFFPKSKMLNKMERT